MLRSELQRLFGPTPFPVWLRAILFAAAYYLCAEVGNFLTPATAERTYVIFWLPAGLYVAVLLLHAPRHWGWFIAAALPANLAFDLSKGTPFYLILVFYASNTVQATLGAWLVQTFVSRQTRLRNVKEFFGFIVLAVPPVGVGNLAYGILFPICSCEGCGYRSISLDRSGVVLLQKLDSSKLVKGPSLIGRILTELLKDR